MKPMSPCSGESWAGDIQKTSATNGVRLHVATKMMWLRIKTKDYTKYTINNNVLLLFTSPCLLSSPFFHLPGLPRYCPPVKMNHLFQSNLNKLASTFSSSNSLKDLVSLAVLFIHWQTMEEQIINPRCHSHYSSTNVSEFFLSFSPHTLSSWLLFWGHTTPLKKNIKELAGRLFLMDIKNILMAADADHSVFSLGCHPQAGQSQPHQLSTQSFYLSSYWWSPLTLPLNPPPWTL